MTPQKSLRKWFFSSRRDLPWRKDPSPYEVWVSEVMLQQTQVGVVIPYFERWMGRFPDIPTLAEASLEEVIKLWEGLGYYSRARNLHDGARYLVARHGGVLPSDPLLLKKVKGLGPYTIGAIMSFAFKRKAPAVDGNVLRTLARFYAIEGEIDKGKTRKIIEDLTTVFLPDHEPWVVMEALIELGALICKKSPLCNACPLKEKCRAYKQGIEKKLPNIGKKIPVTNLYRFVPIIHCQGSVLVKKGVPGKVMADLWEFPYMELGQALLNRDKAEKTIEVKLGLCLSYRESLSVVTHGFTRYRAYLYPHLYFTDQKGNISHHEWVSLETLRKLPFSSGHRKIKEELSRVEIIV